MLIQWAWLKFLFTASNRLWSTIAMSVGIFFIKFRKKFASAQTLNQHVRSKGHNPNMVLEKKEKVEKVPEVFKKNENRCLFSRKESSSFE